MSSPTYQFVSSINLSESMIAPYVYYTGGNDHWMNYSLTPACSHDNADVHGSDQASADDCVYAWCQQAAVHQEYEYACLRDGRDDHDHATDFRYDNWRPADS